MVLDITSITPTHIDSSMKQFLCVNLEHFVSKFCEDSLRLSIFFHRDQLNNAQQNFIYANIKLFICHNFMYFP